MNHLLVILPFNDTDVDIKP